MKGLLKLSSLEEKMPLVYSWLKQAEATRRLVKDNYSSLQGEELLEITTAENVLTQLENLQTYPVIRSKLHQGKMALHAWIFRIESGEVLAYDPMLHDFVHPHSRLELPEHEYNLHPGSLLLKSSTFVINTDSPSQEVETSIVPRETVTLSGNLPRNSRMSMEQSERIYRGSSH
jgi:carbonic anhydrase